MNPHHIARLGQYCSVCVGVCPRYPLGYQGLMKIIWSIVFHHRMNSGGQRRLFSQLIFLQPLQFGPALNARLGKVPWLAYSIQTNLWSLSLWRFPHRNFFCKDKAIKNLRKLYIFRVVTRQSSQVVGAQNSDSVISYKGSLFKRSYLHIKTWIHKFNLHTTWSFAFSSRI